MFTIFHISDLHFGQSLIPTGSPLPQGFVGHDERMWVAFRDQLKSRINSISHDYLVVVTGDLSAFGNAKSYQLASELLFNESASDISKQFGLRLPREKVFIVPGNHDSYDNSVFAKNNLRTFNGIFNPFIERYPFTKEINFGEKRIRFIGIDSTYKKSAITPVKKLGKGLVDLNQIKIVKKLNDKENGFFNIAVMHHSPILVDSNQPRTLILDKSHDVISALCSIDTKMILCGHLHDDFYDSIPIESILRRLPKRRGLKRVLFSIFRETILNEFKQIAVGGKKIRYLDSLAYHYLHQNGHKLLNPETKSEVPSIEFFNNYLRKLPAYKLFMSELTNISNSYTAIIMCGTTCQSNQTLNNSCLELVLNDDLKKVKVIRHKYVREKVGIASKERELSLVA